MNMFQSIRFFCCISLILLASLAQSNVLDELIEANQNGLRLDVSVVHEVFDHSVTESLNIDQAVSQLNEIGSDSDRPELERVKSFLSVAHLQWQFGQLELALEAAENAIGLQETSDGTFLKARLLDASGEEQEAIEWYEKAVSTTDRPEEHEFIQTRLTMIQVDDKNVDSLIELANKRDQEFQNRAAITLAILGHPDKALLHYKPDPSSKLYFRQLIRVAEWSLKAEDFENAYEMAWLAYDATEIRFDALYALALVDEAYRSADKISELIADLEKRGPVNEDLLNLRIDLLIDLERYDDAIDLFRSLNMDTTDIASRQRLVQIYDIAGKSSEMVAEYEQLIESEPSIVQWYVGLASYYINVAQPEDAMGVWHRFETNNKNQIDILVRGGEFMNDMGYVEDATDMIKRHAASNGPSTYGNVFLFETYFKRGRDAEAIAALDELLGSLPADSSDLRIVADGYERLNRFDKALLVFQSIQEHSGKLGYDDRMRLAWLHGVEGNKDVALKMWQEIWIEEESPARRIFAEGQFLQIAAELNTLADIAVDIESKLFSKTASKNDINLLVRIYTEVGDEFSAAEIIREFSLYADISDVDRLRQLGQVYLQLQEYSKYDEVLRQLEQLDTENRIEHIQNIVLNLIAFDLAEGGTDRYEDIQHWLGELRSYDQDAVSGEFEASVLSLGGFAEEAINSYRRALIEQPTHSDNLLLMADLMKENDRTEEAVALLQYVAEHAVDDNEFVVAVDGIINMIGQRFFGQELATTDAAIFRWTQRVILERITGREDKFYLYTLLSDIAQETNNREAQFIALENSVSQAGIRRLSVLREIVTMATPNAGFFSMYQNTGDPERQITYGRRLIGLRQQLPPDVYINIARTLLTQGDTVGAEKSLSLVRDITGQIDINKTKADLFNAAGHSKMALASYSQALSVNRDDLELQFKTATLREANGQLDVANALFQSALQKVLLGLPMELQTPPRDASGISGAMSMALAGSAVSISSSAAATVVTVGGMSVSLGSLMPNTSVSREYRTYYEMIVQGLIATWPDSEVEEQKILDSFIGFFNQELAKVEGAMEAKDEEETGVVQLAVFSRLDHIAKFMRRLCVSIGRTDVSDGIDLALIEHFDQDLGYANTLLAHYRESLAAPNPDLTSAMVELDTESLSLVKPRIEVALDDAVQNMQVEQMARIGSILRSPQEIERMLRTPLDHGNHGEVLTVAKVLLDDGAYTRMLNSVVPQLQEEPSHVLNFVLQYTDLALDIEDRLDIRLVEFDDEYLGQPDIQVMLMSLAFRLNRLVNYVQESGKTEELVRVFEAIVKSHQPNMLNFAFAVFETHRDLLEAPLSEELQDRVFEATSDLIEKMDMQDEYARMNAWTMVLNFDVHTENLAHFLDFVEESTINMRFPDSLSEVIWQYYAGNSEEAFAGLFSSSSLDNMSYTGPRLFASSKWFQDQVLDVLDAIRNGNLDDLEFAKSVVSVLEEFSYYGGPLDIGAGEIAGLFKNLADRFPEDSEFPMKVVYHSLQAGQTSGLSRYLKHVYENDKEEEFIRMASYLSAINDEQFDLALEVALDGGPDLRKKQIRDEIFERNDEEFQSSANESATILFVLRGSAPTMTNVGLVPPAVEKTVEMVQERVADENLESTEVAQLLRLLWRSTQASTLGDSQGGLFGTSMNILPMLLMWPAQGSPSMMGGYSMASTSGSTGALAQRIDQSSESEDESSRLLLEVLMSKGFLGRELELFLSALNPQTRRSSTPMYALVSKAYKGYPEELRRRVAELSNEIKLEEANDHEFTLWLRLVQDYELEPTEEDVSSILKHSRETRWLTDTQLLAIAQLLAKFDYAEEAIDCYEMLVIERFGSEGQTSLDLLGIQMQTSTDSESPDSVLGLIKHASDRLPQANAQDFVERAIMLVQPFSSLPEIRHLYEAFALEAFSTVYPPEQAVSALKKVLPSVDRQLEVVRNADGVRVIRLAKLANRAGDYSKGSELLRSMYSKESVLASDEMSSTSEDMVSMGFVSSRLPSLMMGMANRLGLGSSFLHSSYSYGGLLTSADYASSMLEHVIDLEDTANVNATVSKMIDWLDEGDIDQLAVMNALASVVYILDQMGNADSATTTADSIQQWLSRQSESSVGDQVLQVFATIAAIVEIPLEPRIATWVLSRRVLDQDRIQSFVSALQKSPKSESILEAVNTIDSRNAGLGLLRAIYTLVETTADADYKQELESRILMLERAYESIEAEGGLPVEIEST